MIEKTSQIEDISTYHLAEKVTKLESMVELLEYKLEKEIPPSLADRITILEQKFDIEMNYFKKELSDAKGTMKERIGFISIIVTLIVALITVLGLVITGRV